MQRVDAKNFRQRLLDLYGSCAVVERGKRAGNVAQDGLARRAKFNAVMIMPRGELLSFRAACVATSKPVEMPKVHLRTQASESFKHQLRLHKDRNDGHSAFGAAPWSVSAAENSYPLFPLPVDINPTE